MCERLMLKATFLAVACSLSMVGHAMADDRKPVNVPAGELIPALKTLAQESGVELIYRSEQLEGLKTRGVSGTLAPKEAVARLLEGTSLTFKVDESGAMLIAPARGNSATGVQNSTGKQDANETEKAQRSFSQRFRLAQASQGSSAPAAAMTSGDASPTSAVQLEEIVVTAQKRAERLQDVPIPVSAINAASLAETNQTQLRDYFDLIPGFVVSPGPSAGNQQMLTIRGISSGSFGNPTVGVTVDDVPFGAFTREFAPDIDPSDIARVEVLRGPQGTLYGASSMGGLLKYVTVDPSTSETSGSISAGLSTVQNGSDAGYNIRASGNLPVTDTLALRASAFTRRDPGYIDNPSLGTEGVNSSRTSGGRVSSLWKPLDVFSLKLSALYQKTTADGLSEVVAAPGLNDFQQNYIPSVGQYETTIKAYSASANGQLGRVTLTSVTGYNTYDYATSNDYTFVTGATAQRLFGVSGGPAFQNGGTAKFSQEVRASLPLGSMFDWMIAGFYTHEHIPYLFKEDAENTATGQVMGTILSLDIPINYSEYAAFTDLTVHFTDRFDLQLGGRESHLSADFNQVTEAGALLPTALLFPGIHSTANVFTYLITPQFKVSPDLMTYARIATGYRPTRSNSFNSDPLVPRAASPDKTKNYEVGAKGDLLERRLTFDASVYYIDWKDIQITLVDPRNNLTYVTNGSRAKSEGVELTLTARPVRGLTLGAWGAYNHAVLTEGFPAGTSAFGPEGSPLPFSSKFSGNLSADEQFPLFSNTTGFVGATLTHVGDRLGTFVSTPARAEYPAYTKLDMRAGMNRDAWSVSVYGRNVTGKRVPIGGGAGNFPPTAYVFLEPRTIGVSVTRNF